MCKNLDTDVQKINVNEKHLILLIVTIFMIAPDVGNACTAMWGTDVLFSEALVQIPTKKFSSNEE